MAEKLTKKHAVTALKKVTDPELGLDIYTLELVYDITIKNNDSVIVKMTLTSPMCPYGPSLMKDVKDKLKQKGFKNPEIDLVFEPMWVPSEKVKMLLGLQ